MVKDPSSKLFHNTHLSKLKLYLKYVRINFILTNTKLSYLFLYFTDIREENQIQFKLKDLFSIKCCQ